MSRTARILTGLAAAIAALAIAGSALAAAPPGPVDWNTFGSGTRLGDVFVTGGHRRAMVFPVHRTGWLTGFSLPLAQDACHPSSDCTITFSIQEVDVWGQLTGRLLTTPFVQTSGLPWWTDGFKTVDVQLPTPLAVRENTIMAVVADMRGQQARYRWAYWGRNGENWDAMVSGGWVRGSEDLALRTYVGQRPALAAPPHALAGDAYSAAVVTGGDPRPTVTLTGSLPPGLEWDAAAGLIKGVPTTPGSWHVSLTAANGVGPDAALDADLVVDAIPPRITSLLPGSDLMLEAGFPYSLQLTATGRPAPTWKVTDGVLPAGLTLDPATGLISGQPHDVGKHPLTVTASNGPGSSASVTFDLPVVDSFGPALSCDPQPTILRRAKAQIWATASDEGSGMAVDRVSAAADTSALDVHEVTVTASDKAGNTASVSCPYLVVYKAAIEQPVAGASVRAGRPLRVQVSLADARGLVPDAEAQAFARGCGVAAGFGAVPDATTCLGYNATTDRFWADVPAPGPTGRATVSVMVRSPLGVLSSFAIPVAVT